MDVLLHTVKNRDPAPEEVVTQRLFVLFSIYSFWLGLPTPPPFLCAELLALPAWEPVICSFSFPSLAEHVLSHHAAACWEILLEQVRWGKGALAFGLRLSWM